MAQEALLDRHLTDGKELLRRLQANQFDVTAASWARDDEGGSWSLYVASKIVDDLGLPSAYREARSIIRAATDLCLETHDVKLISPAHPLAKEIVRMNDTIPANLYTRIRLREFGPMRSGEAHVYPPMKVS
jgi:hypothetical protein